MNIIKNFSYTFFVAVTCFLSCNNPGQEKEKIDRKALVSRHNVILDYPDTLASLTVGNGEFAFTVDVSGLQSFSEYYDNGVALGTQAQWGWHAFPNEGQYKISEVYKYDTAVNGNVIPFPVQHKEGRKAEATKYLRENPHRLHLGVIGLALTKENGEQVLIGDLQNVRQELDLYSGRIESRYEVEGVPVVVELYAHQDKDEIAAKITSPLISKQRLKVFFKFPYGSGCHVCPGYDWSKPEKHQTTILSGTKASVQLERQLDTTRYYTHITWSHQGTFSESQKHHFELSPSQEEEVFEFSVKFNQGQEDVEVSAFAETRKNSIENWQKFWTEGGAIDFSGSVDPRAHELERRVVLSQYLTKVNCAGSLPPQETGLTFNSWYGKPHIEMHWWHGVHFALWNRISLLEKGLPWYDRVFEKAKHTAKIQGYKGARWQKMTDPYGDESPSSVAPYLIWQQPHFIYFAELIYRQNPSTEVLEKYKDKIFESAEFMASLPIFSEKDQKFHLASPVIPAQELFPARQTNDPPFELAYWHYGLSVAQEWNKRLGLPENEQWKNVLDNLAPLYEKDGLYYPSATHPESYSNDFYRRDHPVVVGALGYLPLTEKVDPQIMDNTFNEILQSWQWETTWGWDFPMMAMTAARLGRPDKAIDALFMDMQKNTYLPNGHNYQDKRLRIYLPGNGALLTAVAMMAAGWDGAPEQPNPGFPKDGTWNVKWEGLHKMP